MTQTVQTSSGQTSTGQTFLEPTPVEPVPTGRAGADGAWRGFRGQGWRDTIDPRLFLQQNYTPYDGDAGFLTGPTARGTALGAKLAVIFPQERERGVYDVDPHTPASITAHAPGYIDRD